MHSKLNDLTFPHILFVTHNITYCMLQ